MTDEIKTEQQQFADKMAPHIKELSNHFTDFVIDIKSVSENDFDILAGMSSALTLLSVVVFKIIKKAESPITIEMFKERLFETISDAQKRIDEGSL